MLSEGMEDWLPRRHPQGLEFALPYLYAILFFVISKSKKDKLWDVVP